MKAKRMRNAIHCLFSLMNLSSSLYGGPTVCYCIKAVISSLRLSISKKIINIIISSIRIMEQPPYMTLEQLVSVSGTNKKEIKDPTSGKWNKKTTKSIQSIIKILKLLNQSMMCCVLPEYLLNAIQAVPFIRGCLEVKNDDGVSFCDAIHSLASSFSRAYELSHPPPERSNNSSGGGIEERNILEYRRKRLLSFLDHVELELKEARNGDLWKSNRVSIPSKVISFSTYLIGV
jgi:hypothetical protein